MVPKRHHVMKLYRQIRYKVYGPVALGKRLESYNTKYEEVKPLDLDKMNLAALRVLGELRVYLNRGKDYYGGTDQMSDPEKASIYDFLLKHLADLESAADLKAVREILRKANAWDSLAGLRAEVPEKEKLVKEVKGLMQAAYGLEEALEENAQAERNA